MTKLIIKEDITMGIKPAVVSNGECEDRITPDSIKITVPFNTGQPKGINIPSSIPSKTVITKTLIKEQFNK